MKPHQKAAKKDEKEAVPGLLAKSEGWNDLQIFLSEQADE